MASPASVPWLLQQRWDGRLSGRQYRERYRQNRALTCEWNASPRDRIQQSQMIVTTTMDVHSEDQRFLLTGSINGTISIFDLCEAFEKNGRHTASPHVFRPLQETVFSAPNRTTTVQWYPVDTGIFLSAAASSATLWDTANMVPVLSKNPYPNGGRLTCLHQGPQLAAVGSNRFRGTKLIDWKAGGSTTHELSYGSGSRTGAPPSGEVGAVRWSPMHSHILATCTDSMPYIWDIRHTSGPLIKCCGRPLEFSANSNVSPACRSMESLHKKFRSQANHRAECDEAAPRPLVASFDHTGQYLIVAGRQREMAIKVFDILSLEGDSLPLEAKTVIQYGRDSESMIHPVLLVTGYSPRNTLIWIPSGNEMRAYSLLRDGSQVFCRQVNGQSDDPDVVHTLRGHMGPIRCGVVTSTRRSNEAMFTAAADKTIVVWEPHHRKAAAARKRPRIDDTDTWE
jgi:WD40 repeat protein